ncbi:zinc finger BED domain-containing protein 1 [Oreochromis niloticus]|uniref:zinc finger BED domain-containing protein 1 n=1 Tax=Oreochromis niloticus TaxID=8128 RepID=UPI00022B18E0|nr:zinc finger BED domain-containing protein 1 [Oreochromis niloticus]
MDKDGLLGGKFYFKKLPNGLLDKTKVTCTICKAEFRYHRSNSSLCYHLRAKHPAESTSTGPCQSTPQDYGARGRITKQVSEKLTNSLVVWIAKNCRPVCIVEDDGLREVIRAASGDVCYNLPSRETIVSRLHTLFEDQRAQRSSKLVQVRNVALTGDHWTSVNNDNYLGVTAHFIDNDWTLQSFALTVSKTEERQCAEACADHFLSVANEWKIKDKLTTFGTDSARNMVAAARLLPFEHMPCTAHILQRTVTVSLNDSEFERVLAKCRKVVGHFKQSPANAQELKEQQVAHGHKTEPLVRDVPTRWNSTLEMIKRIQRNKSVLTTILAQQNSMVTMVTDQEFDMLQKLEELLEPCRYVTELLGGKQYVSCSVVLPALCYLFRVMELSDDDPVYVLRFKKVFTTDLGQRRDSTNLTWLKIATALDPRFKDLKCLSKDERREVWASVHDLVMAETHAHQPSAQTTEEPSPKKRKISICLLGTSDSDSEEEEDSVDRCLDRYKAEPKIDIEECPLQWWLKREGAHARLAPIACKYLSTPATTVPCERLFSLSGHIIQKRSASLSSDDVNKIVCLSNWLSAKD